MMGFVASLMMFLLVVVAIFLILLILIQRGRGGGLAGAFGGMGGQSAFGTKAGDVFTRITIGTATVWILLCAASVKILGSGESRFRDNLGTGTEQSAPKTPGATGAGDAAPGGDANAPAGETVPAGENAPTTESAPAGEAPSAEKTSPADKASSSDKAAAADGGTAPAEGKPAAPEEKSPDGK
jgi:preprotein translocase subunit SecG